MVLLGREDGLLVFLNFTLVEDEACWTKHTLEHFSRAHSTCSLLQIKLLLNITADLESLFTWNTKQVHSPPLEFGFSVGQS